MAFYSLISFYDPKVEAWSVPQVINGADEEAVKNYVQNLARTIKAGKVAPENDGFQAYRVGVFDDDTGKIAVFEKAQHLIDLRCEKVSEVQA